MPDIPRYSVVDGTLGGLHKITKELTAEGELPPETKVLIWDPNADEYLPLTGLVYDSVANHVILYSDED